MYIMKFVLRFFVILHIDGFPHHFDYFLILLDGSRFKIRHPMIRHNGMSGVDGAIRRTPRPRPVRRP